jgi:Ser/Thr protein kinase RdoA (MazF antagonist)
VLETLVDVSLAMQPCLRDVWHGNVLFTGDQVTGLVDFGAMGVETPAGDVARLLGSMADDNLGDWRPGLEAYTTVRPLSPDELRAAAALDASGTVLAGCNWITWIYIEGRQFESRQQVIERFGRLLERLGVLVERAGPAWLEARGARG